MIKIRFTLIALLLLFCSAASAPAQVSIGIGLPNIRIGINLPLFPELVPVPGYPVYYAPRVDANYFFYDGMYWVFWNNNWYASSWYNGPWALVGPEYVPLYILRIPVRYYREPPVYFRGWRSDAPPHWGEHWGHGWEQHRRGWDKWNRGSAPARAPLPVYQRQYKGDRYPHVKQQQTIRNRNYHYQPHNATIREHYRGQRPAPAHPVKQAAPPVKHPEHKEIRRSAPPRQGGPSGQPFQPPHHGGKELQRPAPVQPAPQQRAPSREQRQQPGAEQRKHQEPAARGGQQRSHEPDRGHGQGQQKGEERGRDHNK